MDGMTTTRIRCQQCTGPMPAMARRHAVVCSSRCRQAAYRARKRAAERDAVPAELTSRRRWVRRAANKAPLTAAGLPASSTDPATWSTYRQAARSQAGVGLGFVLAEGDGIVCIDLDHCLDRGRLADWAQPIVEQAAGTYIEMSPSGTGLHLWGLGTVGRGRRIRRGAVAIEVYGQGRYIAMGTRYDDAPMKLADLTGLVDSLI